ncbi:sugar phosphate isomerase/epimerase family protein [Paracoccus litorisediminis]|jgi:sugar phosphate isomerase/epimerase|uniref:TIM barrel protein n=1 Tax=Paracoccus litorisediminis TaxID=2006130 RepID=A0A844HN02_9RHOB|nr:sugar phosphate isomerase/epimerase [Paracoccus litorisediminis]MTH59545.1 TIM barrel protein [Paracoccus litorisediminis]
MPVLSYQLYSSRNFSGLEQTCDMLARAGYEAVEPYGALLAQPDTLARAVEENDLRVPSAHVNLAELEADPDRFIALAARLGIRTYYAPYVMPDQRPTDGAGWREFGARLDRAGAPLREAGLGFGWHNHDFEFVPTADGVVPMEAILQGGPDLEWEADIAWIIRGGADPYDWIARHADRITAAHVKDIAPAGEKTDEDGWADPGTGVLDWPALYAALGRTKAGILVMEHDNPSDDARFARAGVALNAGLEA